MSCSQLLIIIRCFVNPKNVAVLPEKTCRISLKVPVTPDSLPSFGTTNLHTFVGPEPQRSGQARAVSGFLVPDLRSEGRGLTVHGSDRTDAT